MTCRPQMDELCVDPCIPCAWDGFEAVRKWRGATYRIQVRNPQHISKGVKEIYVDGARAEKIPVYAPETEHEVVVIMGQE